MENKTATFSWLQIATPTTLYSGQPVEASPGDSDELSWQVRGWSRDGANVDQKTIKDQARDTEDWNPCSAAGMKKEPTVWEIFERRISKIC